MTAAPEQPAAGGARALLLRATSAAATGWLVTVTTVRPDRAEGRALLAAGVLAAAATGSGTADRWHPRGLWSGLALVTGLGLYAGVPETNHIVGLGAGLVVIVLADVTGRLRADGSVVVALQVTLVWAALRGAGARPGTVVVALAMLGLLALLPLAAALPGPRRPILSERWVPVVLVLVQAVFALALARLLAWRGLGPEVVVATGGALLLLVLAARLVMGRHPWSND